MAKTKLNITEGNNITNKVLEVFLLRLSVEGELRERYSSASDNEKRQMLATEFNIGDATIEALVDIGEPGAVQARFGFSDQQGTPSVKLSPSLASRSKGAKKR